MATSSSSLIEEVMKALDVSKITDPVERSNSLKEEGNKYFKNGVYDAAIEFYSSAINEKPTAILYANRSQAYIKKELFGAALEDAESAIKQDPTYTKAFYRRASANMALGKFKKALRDYEAVYKAHPRDPDAKQKRDECAKQVKKKAFLEAISQDHTKKPITDLINLDSMEVEESYDGPRLEGPITIQFMTALIEHFKRQGRLHIRYAFKILLEVYNYLKTQPNMVEIEITGDNKFTICGDVHGQFYDLCNIFTLNGMPSEDNPYLFNGDFVDRGSFSVETIFTLFGFKMLFPDHFFLARGNHESDVMNKMYGFEGEVKAKYNQLMGDFFTEIFCYLPLCHLINREVFICHGGLFANDEVTFDDIQKVDRIRQPPDSGIMCELLWSDPMDAPGRTASKRGVGTMFGPDVTQRWCDSNGVKYVIRSHEVKPQGYEEQKGGRCYTLFSAPNYCDAVGNLGAFAVISAKNIRPNFTTFEAVPHPAVPAMRYANSLFGL